MINLVFYDAPHTLTGAWADMPPTVPGHTALVSLGRMPAWADTWWPYFLHETFHTLGIGHVTDDLHDLMASPRQMGVIRLDPEHDDYWAALMASPYMH